VNRTTTHSDTEQNGDDARVAAALAYDPSRDGAPKLVAKGQGELAARILEIAEDHGVPIRTDAELLAIVQLLDIGDEIPVEAFEAVAEILSYLYRIDAAAPPSGNLHQRMEGLR
jgi:flagellar biosynthesis protein